MLIVRLRQHFRERQTEWALASGATGWGAILINAPSAFDRPFYAPLRRMFDASVWGWGMFLLGLLGLVVLFINGAWQRTPQLRMFSSIGRSLAWSGLFYGCLFAVGQSPAAMIYAMILWLEIMALMNATADGQRYSSGPAADGH